MLAMCRFKGQYLAVPANEQRQFIAEWHHTFLSILRKAQQNNLRPWRQGARPRG